MSAEVWPLHAAEPHVGYVLDKELLHLASRVHVVQVCIHDHLEEHPGIVAAGASAGITGFDPADVEAVDYCTYDSCGMALGKIIPKTWRKQQIIVGIVRFKDYLCHCLIEIIFLLIATTR